MLRLAGLKHPARVRRDAHGVPYIDAACEHDGWLALGFCHGQDRAAQLELVVRGLRGTLASLIGEEGLPIDRLARRVGFRRAGDAQLAVCEPHIVDQIHAYVRGINAGLAQQKPHELALLRARPTRWEPGDVQGYAALLCFALASNWDVELVRLKILAEDGPEALRLLDAPYPGELPLSAPPGGCASAAVDRLALEIERFASLFGHTGGSNAWAVAPSRTRTGRPILANDPHLPAAIPTTVYLACLRTPEVSVAGASWVGLPVFGPGHNGFAAWGVTAAHVDNTDLFLEELSADGRRLRQGDRFVDCVVREERIEVRGRAPVIERVTVTPRGPVITPALDGISIPGRANALSLAATWLAARPYTGMYDAPRVRSFEQFRQSFARGSTSTVSVVYADADGHVGWHVAVEVPRRKSGDGLLPLPGWRDQVGWHDEVHLCTELPHVIDPPEGFVSTCNNRPASGDTPYLGVDFLDGYRQAAISEALAARHDWDIDATVALQRDTRSLPWRAIRPIVLGLEDVSGDAQRARDILERWDGRVASESVGASIYVLFLSEICCTLARAAAPTAADWALGKGFHVLLPHTTLATRRVAHLVRLLREQPPGLVASYPAAIGEALARTIQRLRSSHGDDVSAWSWGRVRPLTLMHAFGSKKPFDRIFNVGPLEGEGDPTTISQGGIDFTAPCSSQPWLPTLRAVIDVGKWDSCRFAIAGGQSGNPLSPHYKDQLDAWKRGWGIVLSWSEARIRAGTRATLELLPSQSERRAPRETMTL
jgi:penicillin amidase